MLVEVRTAKALAVVPAAMEVGELMSTTLELVEPAKVLLSGKLPAEVTKPSAAS